MGYGSTPATMIPMFRKTFQWLGRTRFVKNALAEEADLSAFRQKPTPAVLAGVGAIGLSYIIGWPGVALCSYLSVHYQSPWIIAIGGPLVYGLSHLIFLLGMYLAGAEYSLIFLRWLVCKLLKPH